MARCPFVKQTKCKSQAPESPGVLIDFPRTGPNRPLANPYIEYCEAIFMDVINGSVMNDKKNNRSRLIGLRVTPAEYTQLYDRFRITTCQQLSDYIRRVLFEKKITVCTRSKSLDEFMAEMIVLRNELSAIGNNLNQTVRKLNGLDQIPEIKRWLFFNDPAHQAISQKVEEIKIQINKFSDQWSQE
jgi:MobC-like protein